MPDALSGRTVEPLCYYSFTLFRWVGRLKKLRNTIVCGTVFISLSALFQGWGAASCRVYRVATGMHAIAESNVFQGSPEEASAWIFIQPLQSLDVLKDELERMIDARV